MADQSEPRHGLADHLEAELPKLKAEWETGSFTALEKAFVWCAGNGYTFPKWLMDAVRDELAYSKANRPRGGTKKGNSEVSERYERLHRTRHMLMKQCLDFQQMEREYGLRSAPINKTEAARAVQKVLGPKHPAWGTENEIIKSHRTFSSRD